MSKNTFFDECSRRDFLRESGKMIGCLLLAPYLTETILSPFRLMNKNLQQATQNKYSPNEGFYLNETNRPKIGLALGSGALRGLAHAGLIRALIEHKIPLDCLSGSSIGAVIAAIYCSRENWSVEEWDNVARKIDYIALFRALAFPTSLKGILSNGDLRLLLEKLISVKYFEELPKSLSVVATSLTDSSLEVFKKGSKVNLIDAVLASASVPPFLPPVKINGTEYSDGSSVRRLPAQEVAVDVDFVIGCDVGPQKGDTYKSKSWLDVSNRAIEVQIQKNYEESLNYVDYLIKLSPPEINLRNLDKIYEAGYDAGLKEIPKLINVMNSKVSPRKPFDIYL